MIINNTMASTINEKVYKDLSLSFTPNPITGNVNTIENEDAIIQALKNLIFTNYFEVPYESFLGADLNTQLFENFTSFTEHNIRKQIIVAVENYEPRVELIRVRVSADEDNHGVNVTIKFRINNSTQPIELNLILDRVR
jgi:phage baseplate assembly protein W